MERYYEETKHIIQTGILLEDVNEIQQKMLELSKMNNVNAIKLLYLIIKLQEKLEETYLISNLDYQDKSDNSTICINLANNTVKASYRLLDLIISSFSINPYLRDERNCTIYGYLMAHLIQIYRSDNNFHSRKDLEKLMVKLSKVLCEQYPFDVHEACYYDRNRKELSYEELVESYHKRNPQYLDKKSSDGNYQKMQKILNNMKLRSEVVIPVEEHTKIKDWDQFSTDERFTKYKRYTFDTLEFAKKHL